MKIDITFTESEIIEILRQHVINQGFEAGQGSVNISNEWKGQGVGEHQEPVFKGIVITNCSKDKMKKINQP